MNVMARFRTSEGDVVTLEAVDVKVEAQGKSLDEVKKDVREIRADVSSLRNQMHAGFMALNASVADLRATIKSAIWAFGAVGTLVTIFFAAGNALHWFDAPAQANVQRK